jgi:hypothetical protein
VNEIGKQMHGSASGTAPLTAAGTQALPVTGGANATPGGGNAAPASSGGGAISTPPVAGSMATAGAIGGSAGKAPGAAGSTPTAGTSAGAKLIPAQFEDAVTADKDILTVVMDGGGNDVLICDQGTYPGCDKCKEMGAGKLPVCLKIVDVPSNTPIGGPYPNEIADLAMPMWKATCAGAGQRTGGKLHCHFVDMVPVFKEHDDYYRSSARLPVG